MKLLFLYFFLFLAFFLPSALAEEKNTCTKEPARTAQDCFFAESYNKKTHTCVSRIPQTTALQRVISKKITHIGQYAPHFSKQHNILSFQETQNIFTYEIKKQAIVKPFPHPNEKLLQIYGNKKEHWKIWKAITKMYPKKYRKELKLFRIFSDGVGGKTAQIGLLRMPKQKNSQWGIAIDPADRDDLPYTLLHELAHILVNSPEERAREARFLLCKKSGEKTTIRNSYFRLFAEEFWENNNYLPPDKGGLRGFLEGESIFNLPPDQLEEIDEKYGPFFITEYASTNVTEDFAETFAHFVLLPKPFDDETSVVSKKLRFFWQFEEMTRLRDSLRFGVLMLVGK